MSRAPEAAANSAADQLSSEKLRFGVFHAARTERSSFSLDVGRSLQRHFGPAVGLALAGILSATAYLLLNWPIYSAETLVYVQPAPAVRTSQGVVMHWPYNYDPATYESYIQQQIIDVTRQDVLQNALGKLRDFRKSSESNEQAIERLRRSIEVGRVGNSYQLSIKALSRSAQVSADVANAVAASYLESTAQDRQADDAERLSLLREEADRVKNQLQSVEAGTAASGTDRQTQSSDQSGYLSAEAGRLQRRYNFLEDQIQDLSIEDSAPGTAHLTMTAVASEAPVADGVVPKALIFAAAFCLLGILAAVFAQKLDRRLYVAADLERLVGFGPIAQLPDFSEVREEAFDEQLLLLAAAVDGALMPSSRKSCVITGASCGAGVTTIATRVRSLMDKIGRNAVLLDAAGDGLEVRPADDENSTSDSQQGFLLKLGQEADERANLSGNSAVLVDAAPLSASASTESLIRKADCVVVVVESGVTTHAELRSAAKTLQRLDAPAVGFVLNRVSVANADADFKHRLAAIEEDARMRRRKAEKRPLNTRKVEAEPARVPPPEQEERRHATEAVAVSDTVSLRDEVEKPNAGAPQQPQSPGVRGRLETMPAAQMRVSPAPSASTSPAGAISRNQAPLPWWLADPLLNPNAPSERVEEPVGAEPLEAVNAVSEEPESRLSGLRKLFANRNANAAAPGPEAPERPKFRGGAGGLTVPEVSNLFRQQPEESRESKMRRGTPEVTTVPEFLPPRKSQDVKRDPDAASRRDRRDTWDDVAVLPSWRGQYRRKE